MMKKLVATLLIIYFAQLTTMAEVVSTLPAGDTDKIAELKRKTVIEDELLQTDSFPRVVPSYIKDVEPITDELIIPYSKSDEGKTIHLWVRKNDKSGDVLINDELITPKFREKFGAISILKNRNKAVIEDNLAKTNLSSKQLAKVRVKNTYDFTKTQIPVQLKIIKNLTTRHNVLEGDSILFKTIKDVSLNGIDLPKGTQIIGRVETLSESDKMGCPANIVVDNFYVKDNPEICFYGNVTKTGANRSIWVYPLYQAGNIILYVAGFVFVPIHGGHAKLLTSETYTVFYETR
ncbi:MAG: hypothetical protein K6E29_05945 [Cyanobacteria bacterium RUI128]|nr:hypothetical protein [Cyanobacteria bacterium RUI128]